MANPRPWFAFHASDWLCDTLGWSPAARGAHIQMMAYWWANQNLPSDSELLRGITGVRAERWQPLWDQYLSQKWEVNGEQLLNKRLSKTLAEAERISGERAVAGRKGGLSKPSNSQANAKQSMEQKQASHSHSHSHKKESPPTPLFDKFWKAYPKKVGKKQSRAYWDKNKLDTEATKIQDNVTFRLAQDSQWKRGFILDPIRYLRGERWKDESIQTVEAGKAPPLTEAEYEQIQKDNPLLDS